MKRCITTLLAATMSLGLSLSIAHGQPRGSERDELNSRVQTVNSLADRRGGMRDAIHDVSVETGVPEEQLHRMHDNHPNAGPAGLMVASVLADETKERPERFLNARENGRGWASIARENGVPLEKINQKLDNLERELNQGLPATGYPNGRNYDRGYSPGYNNGGYRY